MVHVQPILLLASAVHSRIPSRSRRDAERQTLFLSHTGLRDRRLKQERSARPGERRHWVSARVRFSRNTARAALNQFFSWRAARCGVEESGGGAGMVVSPLSAQELELKKKKEKKY